MATNLPSTGTVDDTGPLVSILKSMFNDHWTKLQAFLDHYDEDNPAVAPVFMVANREYSFGHHSIGVFYHQYFSQTPSSLDNHSVPELRKWLKTVHLAREASGAMGLPPDEFSPGGVHRDWLLL